MTRPNPDMTARAHRPSPKKKASSASPKSIGPIERAIEDNLPGKSQRPVSHEEMMRYLREVLVPALEAIARRLAQTDEKPPYDAERQQYSIVWARTSEIMSRRRPRPQDAPVMRIAKLLAETKSISPGEVYTWTTRHYSPGS